MMDEVIEGNTICGAIASRCRCVKSEGHVQAHDAVHACADSCGGSWTGTGGEDDFVVVSLPMAIPLIDLIDLVDLLIWITVDPPTEGD